MSEGWKQVTKSKPCPVCSKPDWCCFAPEGNAVMCMRVESSKQLSNGGFLHRTGESLGNAAYRMETPRFTTTTQWEKLQETYRNNLNGQLAVTAKELGVSEESLGALGIGWDGEAATFPMRNAAGQIVGIRRRWSNGKKKSVTGGREGIFIPDRWPTDAIYIVEGPTDAAALLTLGVSVIGRPHCLGGGVEIEAMACSRRVVAIIADNDAPGLRGANILAKRLNARVISPPEEIKDARQWLAKGMRRQDLA